jgi:sporulation protein YlmC with PRC-barrel domain
MKLVKNAKVFSADGKEIGRLSRYVLDPRTKNITNIVFERGLLNKDEYIVPMRQVDHVDEQGVHLNDLQASQVDDLAHFLEEQFVVSSERALLNKGEVNEQALDSYYYYPGAPIPGGSVPYPDELFIAGLPSTNFGTPASIPPTGETPPVVRHTKENIPRGTVAVSEGAQVFTSDMKHIGDTEKVFVNAENGQATHLLVSKGVLLKEHKLIPINWVEEMAEDKVYLAVDEPFVSRLPDYQEK